MKMASVLSPPPPRPHFARGDGDYDEHVPSPSPSPSRIAGGGDDNDDEASATLSLIRDRLLQSLSFLPTASVAAVAMGDGDAEVMAAALPHRRHHERVGFDLDREHDTNERIEDGGGGGSRRRHGMQQAPGASPTVEVVNVRRGRRKPLASEAAEAEAPPSMRTTRHRRSSCLQSGGGRRYHDHVRVSSSPDFSSVPSEVVVVASSATVECRTAEVQVAEQAGGGTSLVTVIDRSSSSIEVAGVVCRRDCKDSSLASTASLSSGEDMSLRIQ